MSSTGGRTQRHTEGQILRDLFDEFGMDWFISSLSSSPDELLDRFKEAADRYREKLDELGQNDQLSSLTVGNIQQVAEDHPDNAETFLQVFASSCSPEMLAMTWMLLHEVEVESVDLSYERRQIFDLSIELSVGRGGGRITFESDSVFDMAVLRHFGMVEADDRPLVSGIFPLNLTWDE